MFDEMRKILIAGQRDDFLDVLSTYILLDGNIDADICKSSELGNLGKTLSMSAPDELVISAALADSMDLSRYSCTIRTYANTQEEYETAKTLSYETYGMCAYDAEKLAECIITGRTMKPETMRRETTEPVNIPESPVLQTESQVQEVNEIEDDRPVAPPWKARTWEDELVDEPSLEQFADDDTGSVMSPFATRKRWKDDMGNSSFSKPYEPPVPESHDTSAPQKVDKFEANTSFNGSSKDKPEARPPYESMKTEGNSQTSTTSTGREDLRTYAKVQEAKRRAEQADQEMQEMLKERRNLEVLQKVAGLDKKPAKLIAFTSGKGGVGKTTLCVELATMLALTNHNGQNYKVCIVDMNLDFGNVYGSLNLNTSKKCMTDWAVDMRERRERGYSDMEYTEAEIKSFLQQVQKYPGSQSDEPAEGFESLYALCAPFRNIDTANITRNVADIDRMVDNLVRNGGFDYVLLDTGNNTRDTVLFSVKRADYVFLIVTQDVNAAASDWSFHELFETLHHTQGIDMNKFKVVINCVRPTKEVGLSINDVKNYMRKIGGDWPLETVCTIKDSNDVRRATNDGIPLVFSDSSHEFTASIGELVSIVTEEPFVLEKPKKKGLWARLFGK